MSAILEALLLVYAAMLLIGLCGLIGLVCSKYRGDLWP